MCNSVRGGYFESIDLQAANYFTLEEGEQQQKLPQGEI